MTTAPLAWLDDVVERFGQSAGPDEIRVPLTQKELAERTRRSPGTIAYNVRALTSDKIITQRTPELRISRKAMATARHEHADTKLAPQRRLCQRLAETWGTPTGTPGEVELLVHGWRPPTRADVAALLQVHRSTAHTHLSRLTELGLMRRQDRRMILTGKAALPETEPPMTADEPVPGGPVADETTGGTDAIRAQAMDLLHVVVEANLAALTVLGNLLNEPRTEAAQNPRELYAQIEDLSDLTSRLTEKEEDKKNITMSSNDVRRDSSLPSSSTERERDATQSARPGIASTRDTKQHSPDASDAPVGPNAVDTAVQPLCAELAQRGRRTELDANGRRILGCLTPAQLTAGGQRLVQLIDAGTNVTNPFGLLCHWVQNEEWTQFETPPPVTQDGLAGPWTGAAPAQQAAKKPDRPQPPRSHGPDCPCEGRGYLLVDDTGQQVADTDYTTALQCPGPDSRQAAS